MESRFLRFGRSRRERTVPPRLDLDFQSIPYDSAAAPKTAPILIHQPLGKSNREARRSDDQYTLLKGFSYDSQPSGKTPQFVDTTPKGNGPVKLQTSRRLSSGDLFVTTQHNQRTLEDIREGDYIVGQKSRHELPVQSPKTEVQPTSGEVRKASSLRSRPNTARSIPTSKDSNWTFLPPLTPTANLRSSALSAQSAPATSLAVTTSMTTQTTSSTNANLGLGEGQEQSAGLSPQEPSPTIAALWRAEHGRLAKLYASEDAGRDVPQLGPSSSVRGTSQSSLARNVKPTSATLDLLPKLGLDAIIMKRASDGSSRSSNYQDDSSDLSSQNRKSTSSSWAASSTYTTQTSAGDAESPTTRENIRKVIDDMRATYLMAIEAQSPSVIKKKSTKRSRKPRLGASPHLDSQQSFQDRQTWHGQDTTLRSIDEQLLRRTTSHSSQAYGRLSPIEASPSRIDKSSEAGTEIKSHPDLKRADSMTLGGLMVRIPESPESPNEATENSSKAEVNTEQRSPTDATPHSKDWLHLNLPDDTFMSETSQKDRPAVKVEELATPRYMPTTSITSRPTTAPVNNQILLSSFPKIPPSRPVPPPLSLAELVNFI